MPKPPAGRAGLGLAPDHLPSGRSRGIL